MQKDYFETNLASKLLYLPVSREGRIGLWLTFRNEKPVSTIHLRKNFNKKNINKRGIIRLLKWLEDASLEYCVDRKNDYVLHVSKKKSLAKRTAAILWSEKKELLIEKGKLFGYPKEASKVYARLIAEKKWPKENRVLQVIAKKDKNFPHYWAPYTRYIVRSSHAVPDSLIAKRWADIIRKEIPKLGIWFENELKNSRTR